MEAPGPGSRLSARGRGLRASGEGGKEPRAHLEGHQWSLKRGWGPRPQGLGEGRGLQTSREGASEGARGGGGSEELCSEGGDPELTFRSTSDSLSCFRKSQHINCASDKYRVCDSGAGMRQGRERGARAVLVTLSASPLLCLPAFPLFLPGCQRLPLRRPPKAWT